MVINTVLLAIIDLQYQSARIYLRELTVLVSTSLPSEYSTSLCVYPLCVPRDVLGNRFCPANITIKILSAILQPKLYLGYLNLRSATHLKYREGQPYVYNYLISQICSFDSFLNNLWLKSLLYEEMFMLLIVVSVCLRKPIKFTAWDIVLNLPLPQGRKT